jgi:hypothetical protein
LYIIFIRQYKKKILILSILLVLSFLSYFLFDLIIDKSMVFNVTINNCLTFSYPLKYQVSNIYINNQLEEEELAASYTFKKPKAVKFSNYKSLSGKFSFDYPSAFMLDEKNFSGSDILYHIDFFNKKDNVHGFVQVWNQPYSLEDFLQSSKETSQSNFVEFSSKSLLVNNNPGYYWNYTVETKSGEQYKGCEVFFMKNKLMYRISYFTPQNMWNKKQLETFWNIVKSFKTY